MSCLDLLCKGRDIEDLGLPLGAGTGEDGALGLLLRFPQPLEACRLFQPREKLVLQ